MRVSVEIYMNGITAEIDTKHCRQIKTDRKMMEFVSLKNNECNYKI